MIRVIVSVVVALSTLLAIGNFQVMSVEAHQRYPWNGKVDIDFTLDLKPRASYQRQIDGFGNVGKLNLPVKIDIFDRRFL